MSSHSDLTIQVVWESKSSELVKEIVATWEEAKALPKNVDATTRAQEVVLVVRDNSQKIVGITTAKNRLYAHLKNELYFIRGFIVPKFRIPGLFARMIIQTLNTLESDFLNSSEEKRPIGAIAEVENSRLKQANVTRLTSGMTLLGFSPKDHPVYVYYFKGARY